MEENKEKDTNNISKNEDKENEPSNSLSSGVGILKIIFWIIFIFFLLFILALLALQFFIKVDYHKKNINTEIAKMMQLNKEKFSVNSSLIIEGDIKFRSFFPPHIEISNISGKDLIVENYKGSIEIPKVFLFLSWKDLLNKKIVINKIKVFDLQFNVQNINRIDFNILTQISNLELLKFYQQNFSNINIDLINNYLNIKNLKYDRIFSNINSNIIISSTKININGNLSSNKQPIKYDINFKKGTEKYYEGIFFVSSQAFIFNTRAKITLDNLKFIGETNIDIKNPQIFSRTIFNYDNFFFQRVIANNAIQINFNINLENSNLNISQIIMNGNDLKGSGELFFSLKENINNILKFDFEYVNFDNLIIKNLTSKEKIIEKDIDLSFNMPNEFINNNKIATKDNININIRQLKYNNENISNLVLQFQILQNKFIEIQKIYANLPFKTILNIEKNNFSLKGENLKFLWNFINNNSVTTINNNNNTISENNLKTIQPSLENNNINYNLDGNIFATKNKINLHNLLLTTKDLTAKNNIEIILNSGISYITFSSEIEKLDLDFIMDVENNENSYNFLKNKILFLNNFSLPVFAKFNILNIKFKELQNINYSFNIEARAGKLKIYNLNLNEQIRGLLEFDISTLNPVVNANLLFSNINLSNKINFNQLLFFVPTFEGIFGTLEFKFENIYFRNQIFNNIFLNGQIRNGIFNILNFDVEGLEGKCKITGFLALEFNRKLNLTLNACTAKLENLLPIFDFNVNNIFGLSGFSAVIYTEGRNLKTFIDNYILKLQIIGNGILIKNFGLSKLSSTLFEINQKPELLNTINAEEIIFKNENETTFSKIQGNLQWNKKNGGQLNANLNLPLINGNVISTFDIKSDFLTFDLNANFVLLTGTFDKTLPLNLVIAITKNSSENINKIANLQQINSYIESLKEKLKKIDTADSLNAN